MIEDYISITKVTRIVSLARSKRYVKADILWNGLGKYDSTTKEETRSL